MSEVPLYRCKFIGGCFQIPSTLTPTPKWQLASAHAEAGVSLCARAYVLYMCASVYTVYMRPYIYAVCTQRGIPVTPSPKRQLAKYPCNSEPYERGTPVTPNPHWQLASVHAEAGVYICAHAYTVHMRPYVHCIYAPVYIRCIFTARYPCVKLKSL